jgi:hypothetical protein
VGPPEEAEVFSEWFEFEILEAGWNWLSTGIQPPAPDIPEVTPPPPEQQLPDAEPWADNSYDFDHLVHLDLFSGVVTTAAHAVSDPGAASRLSSRVLSPGLRCPLIFPAKLDDSHRWLVLLEIDGVAVEYIIPESFTLGVFDPTANDWVTVVSAVPVVANIGIKTWALEVSWPREDFEHLVSRVIGSPACLLDAELRMTTAFGKVYSSRTFRIWLEDSAELAD